MNILLRAPNWIGDGTMCTPALMDVREGFPRAKITLWAKPGVAELLRGHPAIDKTLVYDPKGRHAGLRGKWVFIQDLRRLSFDLTILFQNAFEAALLTTLARIPERIGYATDGRGFLLSKSVPLQDGKETLHQVQYFQELVRQVVGRTKDRAPNLVVSEEEEEGILNRFPELARKEGGLLIGVNPGSVYGSAKRWMPERFAEAADRLLEGLAEELDQPGKVKCVLVGGAGEEALGQRISHLMRNNATVLSGKTNLRELMGIVKHCSVFLTNDTGPMHIANAFGIPLVAIFGPTDPRNTSPFGNGENVVRFPVRCSPCLLRHCPIDHRCMDRVLVEDVVQAAMAQCRATFIVHQ